MRSIFYFLLYRERKLACFEPSLFNFFLQHFIIRAVDESVFRGLILSDAELGVDVALKPVVVTAQVIGSDVGQHRDVAVEALRDVDLVARQFENIDAAFGKRIAANFVNVIARASTGPRVEVLGPRLVALRFAPDAPFERPPDSALKPGKFSALDQAAVEYRLPVPEFVQQAGPVKFE